MKKHGAPASLEETVQAFGGLVQHGTAAFGLLGGSSVQMIRGVLKTLLPSEDCNCEIPPPCWMPQPLGEVTSYVCEGGTATIRFRVANCSNTSRKINISVPGSKAGVKITQQDVNLGPMERAVVGVSLSVAVDAPCGERREIIIWFRGCREQFLRWTVEVASRGVESCSEVEVEDCPDLIHHWYDHFYCDRPCTDRKPNHR